jgi:capsular exopolysaccharide synthesis family protein
LISSDLRRPAIADNFGLDKRPGLNEVVIGTANLKEALRSASDMLMGSINIDELLKHPGLERIWILPSGSLPLNPADVLGSNEFEKLLLSVKDDFDVILLDSPPILPVTDATVLSNRVDGVILCYEIGRTSRHALVRAKMQLESAGATILGIILNHTKPETEPLEVYPYYYKYKYYGKKEESFKEK